MFRFSKNTFIHYTFQFRPYPSRGIVGWIWTLIKIILLQSPWHISSIFSSRISKFFLKGSEVIVEDILGVVRYAGVVTYSHPIQQTRIKAAEPIAFLYPSVFLPCSCSASSRRPAAARDAFHDRANIHIRSPYYVMMCSTCRCPFVHIYSTDICGWASLDE
jgi:hypothetical protein